MSATPTGVSTPQGPGCGDVSTDPETRRQSGSSERDDTGMATKDERGKAGERRAARYLRDLGCVVLDTNWRCGIGELDLVVADGAELVVVEVKTRRSEDFGHPFEAVDVRKRMRLWRLAQAWRRAHPEHAVGSRLRLDAIGLTGADPETAAIEHLRDLEVR